jgi:hypothetical protein
MYYNLQSSKEKTMATDDEKQEATMGDTSYFDGMEGQGIDDLKNAVSTAYLSIIQPQSKLKDEANPPGTWRNSATGDNYGDRISLIPLAMKTVWVERDDAPPFMTVGVYEPNSIEVRIERPKPGKRGFPKMFNPSTGFEVKELFTYAVMLENYPEAGVLYFTVPVSSMKQVKQWNSMLRSQRLPTGKIAPIFAFAWELSLELYTNSAGNENARVFHVERGNLVAKDLFYTAVQPAIAAAKDIALLTAPPEDDATDED